MNSQMSLEFEGVGAGVGAVGTLVGRGGAMSCLVLLKMSLLSEFLVANSTLEWSLT